MRRESARRHLLRAGAVTGVLSVTIDTRRQPRRDHAEEQSRRTREDDAPSTRHSGDGGAEDAEGEHPFRRADAPDGEEQRTRGGSGRQEHALSQE